VASRFSKEKNAWTYFARDDDTLVLVTGEKANSLLLEEAAVKLPLILEPVAFRVQKSHVGLFVVPRDSLADRDLVRIFGRLWRESESK